MFFLVFYDLPDRPPGVRQAFYRAVNRYVRENGLALEYLSRSVVMTLDEAFARFVFSEASKRGRVGLCHGDLILSSGL